MKCACKVHEVGSVEQVMVDGRAQHSAAVCCWYDEEGTFKTAARTALAVEALRDRTTNY